jgi:hypothetical protein
VLEAKLQIKIQKKMKLLFFKNLFSLLLVATLVSAAIALTSKTLSMKEAFIRPPKTGLSGVKRIEALSLPDAIQMFYNSKNVFVDIRERQYYEYGHIQNAINIPYSEIDNISDEDIAKLKEKTHVVIYWNSGCCGVVGRRRRN